MIPLTFLAAVLALTLAAFVGHLLLRRQTAERLRRLAASRRMHYAESDLFQITPRVVERFPIPGVSDVRVTDVIYLREGDRYRYVFTVEYTIGVVRTKHRARRAATFCEPRDRASPADWSTLVLAPEDLCLAEQYAQLCGGNEPLEVSSSSAATG